MTNKIVFVFFNLSAPIFGLKILSKQIFSILTGCFGNILYFPGNFSYFALPLGRTGLPMVVRNWRAVPIRALQEKTWHREGTQYIVKIGNFSGKPCTKKDLFQTTDKRGGGTPAAVGLGHVKVLDSRLLYTPVCLRRGHLSTFFFIVAKYLFN